MLWLLVIQTPSDISLIVRSGSQLNYIRVQKGGSWETPPAFPAAHWANVTFGAFRYVFSMKLHIIASIVSLYLATGYGG
jgi:hypothetical protein